MAKVHEDLRNIAPLYRCFPAEFCTADCALCEHQFEICKTLPTLYALVQLAAYQGPPHSQKPANFLSYSSPSSPAPLNPT
jgi:hypothetical protein